MSPLRKRGQTLSNAGLLAEFDSAHRVWIWRADCRLPQGHFLKEVAKGEKWGEHRQGSGVGGWSLG